jgi:hypothetical protein
LDSPFSGFDGPRQEDTDGGSLPWNGLKSQRSAMILNNSLGYGKSKSGAAGLSLGRIERICYPDNVILGYPDALVYHGYFNPILILILCSRYRNRSSIVLDRFTGILEKVDNHLLDTLATTLYSRQIIGVVG